jgi:hypothetical protein
MLPHIPREFVQATSAALVVMGIYLMAATSDQWLGVSFIVLSVWVMNMSESILLHKVQTEMTACLESVRKKQDGEVQDLLYFLRSSNISADPFHSLEAAKLFIDKLPFPSFLMSPNMGILRANKRLTDILGYEEGEIDGVPAARINDLAVMSHVGAIIGTEEYQDMPAMHLRYFYLSKQKNRVHGVLAVTKICDGAFMMVFHPDSQNVITDQRLADIARN